MLVQINTDRNIEGTTEMISHLTELLNERLGRFEEYITRMEVHLSDENSKKEAGDDKKCVLEVRLKGKDPVVLTTIEATVHKSVKIAADKMFLTLEKQLQKSRVQG
jgi:ribosome-associated translation inhibitor RaiA